MVLAGPPLYGGCMGSIIELINNILKVIPIVNKWFSKTPAKKTEERKEDTRDEIEDFKKSGRPKW